MKGFRRITATMLPLLVCGLAVGADTREDVVREVRRHHAKLQNDARNVLLDGECRDLAGRSGYAFQALADYLGGAFERRKADNSEEIRHFDESVLILKPVGGVRLLKAGPGSPFVVTRARPDGTGTYAAMRAGFRGDVLNFADACWKVMDVEVLSLLEDPKLQITAVERVVIDGAPVVKVVFDANATIYAFERGELHFRPDLNWALSFVECRYPITVSDRREHVDQWTIEPSRWPDGAVFPKRVEKVVEYENLPTGIRTEVTFLQRTKSFDKDRLLDPETWLAADRSEIMPQPVSTTADTPAPAPKPVLSANAKRVMKVASPASGVLATLLVASLVDRRRRKSA